jgi:mono/diheme cytochrome c family protein
LYTEEQATAGAAVFGKICAECHEKKDITNNDFRAKWTARPLWDLYELVRTTMPDSNPGGLSRDEYSNALAYILKLNGVPAGPTAVMPDSTLMKNTKLSLPPVAP